MTLEVGLLVGLIWTHPPLALGLGCSLACKSSEEQLGEIGAVSSSPYGNVSWHGPRSRHEAGFEGQ